MSAAVSDDSSDNLLLALQQERLETEIAVFASRVPQGDEAEERRIRNTLVKFVNDAHNGRFPKTRYMRHVGRIIGCAIRDEIFVPWAEVHAKAHLRGTASNLSDEEAFLLEECLPIPQSRPGVTQAGQKQPAAMNAVKIQSSFHGILKATLPDPLPDNTTEPVSCQLCRDTGIECTWLPKQQACLQCKLKRKLCSEAPLRRAQSRAERNVHALTGQKLMSNVGPTDRMDPVVASIHDKLDRITNELRELRMDFRQKRELDNQRWESIYPTILALSSHQCPGTGIQASNAPAGPHMIPLAGKIGKRRPSNDLQPAEAKRLRFAPNSPSVQRV